MLRATLSRQRGLKPLLSSKAQTLSTNINVPSEADVVIIGGGSLGCNTLYQLSKRGVNAVLCERNKITCGTTWHTVGLLWRLRPSDVAIQLLDCATKLVRSLEDETGINPGYINNGGLFISRTEERLKEYQRLHTLGKYYGVESHVITPEEAVKLHPLLNPEDFNAALYSPGDGCIDPTMFCNSLIKGATNKGGKLIEDCPITNILTDTTAGFRKVTGVETLYGTIKTSCVVNACGVWGRNIARLANLDIPLAFLKHAYVITDSIPEAKNTPNVRDHDASICYRTSGNTLFVSGYEENPEIIKEVPEDFVFKLYDLNLSIFGVHLERACRLTPIMKTIGIKTHVCGPESFTNDHKPILGEDPKLSGFFYACGLNAAGMMLGPGCAEQLAIWITKGRPDLPMFDYDIRRFTPDMRSNRAWITETSHEAYATNYYIVFPHGQPLAGRNLKIDMFHEILVAQGAVMEQAQGWERPGYFIEESTAPVRDYDWFGYYDHVDNPDKRYEQQLGGDNTFNFSRHHNLIGQEALAARSNVALFDMSYNSKIYLTGPDAQHAADWLFTTDLGNETEKITYTCTLNQQGGVESDVNVISLNEGAGTLVGPILQGKGYYIVGDEICSYHLLSHFKKEIQKKNFNAVVTSVTEKLGILSIQGPKSGEVLQAITEYPITDSQLPYGMSRLITINGHTCRVLRLSSIGELGYELHIPSASCIPVYNKLAEAGRSFNMKFAGYRALHSLNCEKGNHLWNKDLRSSDNPLEANLEHICRQQGNYLGKTHIDRLNNEGISKRRCFFTISEKIPLWGNETVWRDNVLVGFLRRGEYGYFSMSSIGIGYVAHPQGLPVSEEYIKQGQYEIEIMSTRYPATIYESSPFDPDDQRLFGHYDGQLQEQLQSED